MFLVVSSMLLGCVGEVGPRGPAGGPAPVPPLTTVEQVVAAENDYRAVLGQVPLVRGLACTLYTVPNSTATIVGAALTSKATFAMMSNFNQPNTNASEGLNILPAGLRMLYTSWYVVRCTGKIVVSVSNYYQFDLTSDDGSMLYLDGSLLIDNDGNHAATTKSGTKLLRQGVHDIRLDYMQGPGGGEALSLSAGGSLIPAEVFYR